MTDILVIYGAPAVGKTTLVTYLREKFHLNVLELDEELIKENNSIWPDSSEYRNSVVVPKVLNRISKQKKTIFVTSALNEDLAKKIQKKNGKLVLLYLSKDKLIERNIKRSHDNGEDAADQIRMNLVDQKRIQSNITFDCVISADQSVALIANEVMRVLKQ